MSNKIKKQVLPDHPAFHDGTLDANEPCILKFDGVKKPIKCSNYFEAMTLVAAQAHLLKNPDLIGVVTRSDGNTPIGLDADGRFLGDNGGGFDDDGPSREDKPVMKKETKKKKLKKDFTLTFRIDEELKEQVDDMVELVSASTEMQVTQSWVIHKALLIALPILKKQYKAE
jgi:hypothetical protein